VIALIQCSAISSIRSSGVSRWLCPFLAIAKTGVRTVSSETRGASSRMLPEAPGIRKTGGSSSPDLIWMLSADYSENIWGSALRSHSRPARTLRKIRITPAWLSARAATGAGYARCMRPRAPEAMAKPSNRTLERPAAAAGMRLRVESASAPEEQSCDGQDIAIVPWYEAKRLARRPPCRQQRKPGEPSSARCEADRGRFERGLIRPTAMLALTPLEANSSSTTFSIIPNRG
jgi:hypothetical protein